MKRYLFGMSLVLSVFFSAGASAEMVLYHFDVTIRGVGESEEAKYYRDNYGIESGAELEFDILVDYDRQGFYTDDNGEMHYEEGSFYAELASISIDESLLSYGNRSSNLYSYDFEPAQRDLHFSVGNRISVYETTYCSPMSGCMGPDRFFSFHVNDGIGGQYYIPADYTRSIAAPVPAAVFCFIPSLLLVCIRKRKRRA